MSQASKEERQAKRDVIKLRTELVETRAELVAMRDLLVQAHELSASIPEEAQLAMIHGLQRRLSLGFMGTLK
jgi:hypothetical protein